MQGVSPRSLAGFNSRTREGCDGKAYSIRSVGDLFQFTHPGGVRLIACCISTESGAFQFTHPGGVRLGHRFLSTTQIYAFQFTHPGGVRHHRRGATAGADRFNSRTREGCDFPVVTHSRLRSGFQFTHPGGVRLFYPLSSLPIGFVSIHAPGRGATPQRERRGY